MTLFLKYLFSEEIEEYLVTEQMQERNVRGRGAGGRG